MRCSFCGNSSGISITDPCSAQSLYPEFPFWLPGSSSLFASALVMCGTFHRSSFLPSRAAPRGAKEYCCASLRAQESRNLPHFMRFLMHLFAFPGEHPRDLHAECNPIGPYRSPQELERLKCCEIQSPLGARLNRTV